MREGGPDWPIHGERDIRLDASCPEMTFETTVPWTAADLSIPNGIANNLIERYFSHFDKFIERERERGEEEEKGRSNKSYAREREEREKRERE